MRFGKSGLLLVLLASFSLFAGDIRIGFVDGVKLIEKAPQGDAAKTALENEFKPREQQILALREQIRDLEEELNPEDSALVPLDDQVLIIQKELRDNSRDLKRMQQEMREDLNLRRNEELAKLQRLISNAIVEIAKDEKFDLIVQDAVYASESIDITSKVLDQLNAQFNAN